MLSQLLNESPAPPAQAPASQQSSAGSTPQPNNTMAASTMAAPSMTQSMQMQDDNRPDLPRPYKCPMCDKAFHRLEHQTRHIRTHTGEKPHACGFPGCSKRFSRSDELTRHSRIHNNPNSRRGNKQHHSAAAQAAAQAIQNGMYNSETLQQQVNQINHLSALNHQMSNQMSQMTQMNQMNGLHQNGAINSFSHLNSAPQYNQMQQQQQQQPSSAPNSQLSSPNVSPPNSYATYTSNGPGSYLTRNMSGDISPAQGTPQGTPLGTPQGTPQHRPMDINMLANAASHIERETNSPSQLPNQHLSLPSRYSTHPYHNHPYHTGRMPSLSSYHYSSNPTSQPMSRSHSEEDHYGHRAAKKSRPGSPQSTAPPSPEFPGESTSPTPDHTPLATPSHSPRLRPQYFHNGVQLPTLHHLSLQHQPPPALAPVEPSADGQQPYVPAQHSGLRISEIMEAGDGAQRKLPLPLVPEKDNSYTKINELVNPESGHTSGQSSARVSEAGNDLRERT